MKAIVLDNAWPGIPLLIREMSRQGIDVLYLSPDVASPDGVGRYCRQRRAPDMKDPDYRRFLLGVLETESFDCVLPLCDELQRLAWDLPDRYVSRVFPTVDRELRELFADRRLMDRFVRGIGIATPRAEDLPDVDALPAIGRSLGWPLVLRGLQGSGGSQVKIADDEAAARAACATLARRGPVFAQEYVRGDLYIAGALVDTGRVRQMFMAKVLESWPSPTGPSIRVISADEPALRALSTRLFTALRSHGLVMADFIRPSGGDYRFLEVNPRLWGSIAAAEVCGAPLLDPFVRLLRGAPIPPPRTYQVGRRVTLFPQFIHARLQAGSFPRIADLPHYRAMLPSIRSLSSPLLRHHLRRLYWQWSSNRTR